MENLDFTFTCPICYYEFPLKEVKIDVLSEDEDEIVIELRCPHCDYDSKLEISK